MAKELILGRIGLFIEQLSDKTETNFLEEPQPEQLNDQLWKWDILFFAGHSYSKEKRASSAHFNRQL